MLHQSMLRPGDAIVGVGGRVQPGDAMPQLKESIRTAKVCIHANVHQPNVLSSWRDVVVSPAMPLCRVFVHQPPPKEDKQTDRHLPHSTGTIPVLLLGFVVSSPSISQAEGHPSVPIAFFRPKEAEVSFCSLVRMPC